MKKTTKRNTDRKSDGKKPEQIRYTHTFKINRSTTLLELLLAKVPGLSRNSIKSLLSGHKVLVNGAVVSQFNYPLAKDDEVRIAKNTVKSAPIARPTRKGKGKVTCKLPILYEDDEFLAVNKPNGLLSVESDHDRECAYTYVVDYLRAKDPKSRPYVLHRIDKETSGVLIFAKDIKVHSMLRMHWNENMRLREYIAVVEGTFKEKSGTLTSFLKENENNMVYVSNDPHGKKAITHYQVLEENESYSMLRVAIDTGRKNQIRVQMASLGHPVVGDEKYGEGEGGPLKRLGLHASKLEFMHPITRKRMNLSAPIPPEFSALFTKTKLPK